MTDPLQKNVEECLARLNGDWPKPKPLPEARPPVPAFDPELLPESLRPWVEDISERIQCPTDYAAIGAMVALSSVIGRRIGICPKKYDDWLVVPNLWGGIIGRPGIMKTPALAEAMRPLRKLEAQSVERYEVECSDYELEVINRDSQLRALQAELQAAHKGRKEHTRHKDAILNDIKIIKDAESAGGPVCNRYETNDTTVEKLGELLANNPDGLLVFRDELVGWLRNLDKPGQEGARAFFLESWDGKSGFTYDRIGRGTLRIESACVSVLGGIQPGPLAKYVHVAGKRGEGADGLLQRFQLLVYPDEPRNWKDVDRLPDSAARFSAFSTFETLAFSDAKNLEADISGPIPFLRFDDAGQELFTEWRDKLETEKLRRDEPEIFESHLSKYRSLIPSLALILHLADGNTGPVNWQSMAKAEKWADYLEHHMRRIYSMGMDASLATCALARRILAGDVKDGFKPKDVYDKHWRDLDKGTTWAAVDTLENLDWLDIEEIPTRGRPSTVCRINPNIFSGKVKIAESLK